MNADHLRAFLDGKMSGSELQAAIEAEVGLWSKTLAERGRSAAITLDGMNARYDITPARALRLLNALLTDALGQEAFAYVVDALLLEERFRWTSLDARDVLESVIAPENRRDLDRRRAWQAREELGLLVKK